LVLLQEYITMHGPLNVKLALWYFIMHQSSHYQDVHDKILLVQSS